MNEAQMIEKAQNLIKENDFEFVRKIGSGGFGVVSKVKKDKKSYAIKVMFPNEKNKVYPELVKEFRGKNLVKILYEKYPEDQNYYFYVMELSSIGSLLDFHKYLGKKLIFKDPFIEKIGDNLMRFFAIQMVNGLRTLFEGNLVHFDIKPDNVLIFKGLECKLIDFSLLRKLCPDKLGGVPGGTLGYFTPEYLKREGKMNDEIYKKQDYFAIGLTLFYLKYGEHAVTGFLRDKNNNMNETVKNDIDYLNYKITLDCLLRAKNKIESQPFQDAEFNEFLLNLIQLDPDARLDFEKIIRNNWLNKNKKEIEKIRNINISDEDNILIELQKSDFLNDNKKNYRKYFDEKIQKDKENYKYIRKGKFKFGRKR
jgi:serine/threonine protein kinase